MKLPRRRFLNLAAGAGALLPLSRLAHAQGYPVRPIRVIVPYPPGGPTDVVARIVANSVAPILGQSMVVENRLGGAGGTLGSKYVSVADPDGYTLLMSIVGSLTITPSLYKLDYDPLKDLAPIVIAVQNPEILTITPSLPVNSVDELIAYAKSNPGKLNLASPGVGTLPHLLGELLQIVGNFKMTHVPYHGASPAIIDLISGQMQVMFNNPSVVLAHLEAGRLRALAVTSDHRFAAIPNVPTFAELGYPRLTATEWLGLLAPAATPEPIIQKLNSAVNEGLRTPQAQAIIQKVGVETRPVSPKEFKEFMAAETRKWAEVVAQANIKAE